MFTECNYISEESKCLRIEVDTFGEVFKPYTDFREALSDILQAIDSCDTYCISEDFECCGFSDGYLRLYNLNRNVVYYLWNTQVEEFMKEGCIRLSSNEPSEDDRNDFEAMF